MVFLDVGGVLVCLVDWDQNIFFERFETNWEFEFQQIKVRFRYLRLVGLSGSVIIFGSNGSALISHK